MDIKEFDNLESNVRFYCRRFGEVFNKANGDTIYDNKGRGYIDFFSSAGSLNYGHNHPLLKAALIDYISQDGIASSLDMHTVAKAEFMTAFTEFRKQNLDGAYRLMFTGPTGANAVEAALKLARKITKRATVGAFTGAFHGVSLGALSVTGSSAKRLVAGVSPVGVDRYPFDGYHGPAIDTLEMIRRQLTDPSSGYDLPAAFIVETVQAEGGLNVGSSEWLVGLAALCRELNILLIVDDIQAGCGRTGSFFSFQRAGIRPDIVCLSKSLSGFGLPLSMLMIREDLDQWSPGEHNGTFRGNNHAFVTGKAALALWEGEGFRQNLAALVEAMESVLEQTAQAFDLDPARGVGMMRGLRLRSPGQADAVCAAAFKRGLLLETCGAIGDVIKFMPPLTISLRRLFDGFDIINSALREVLQ